MAALLTQIKFHAVDANDNDLNGGKVYSYTAGTLTPLATFTDAGGGTPNANPVILDSTGRASIWLGAGLTYRFIVKNSLDVVQPDGDVDNIVADAANQLRLDLADTSNSAKGDALVGVKRLNTGAVATTEHAWHEAQVINAKAEFGAVGDGTTDDTTAIQAAITAAGAGTVILSKGTYKISATLNISQGATIVGAGYLSTTIAPTAAVVGSCFLYQPGGLTTSGITIRDLGFSGNATTLNAVSLKNLTYVRLEGLYISGFTNAAAVHVLFENVEDSHVERCLFLNITSIGVRLITNSNNNLLLANAFTVSSAGGVGISIEAGIVQTAVIGNNFEGSGTGGIGLTCNGTIATLIEGNFFENFIAGAIVSNSGTSLNLAIRDNHLHATSAAAAAVVLNSGSGTNDRITVENNYYALLGNGGQVVVGCLFGSSTNIWSRGNKSGGAGTGIVSVGGITQALADYMTWSGPLIVQNGRVVQSPAFAATLNVNASLGEHVFPGALTGNITIAAPTGGSVGQELSFNFLQDGTGARTVAWNAVFLRVTWSDAGNVANARASIRFVSVDGTNWLQVGAQKLWS